MNEDAKYGLGGASKIRFYEQAVQREIKGCPPVRSPVCHEFHFTFQSESCGLPFVPHDFSSASSVAALLFLCCGKQGLDEMKIIYILFYNVNPHPILCFMDRRLDVIPPKRLDESHDLSCQSRG